MILIDGYVIDCSLTEEHSFEAEATTYPVESGSDITDNVRPLPIVVTIEGIVSDTPLADIALLREAELPTVNPTQNPPVKPKSGRYTENALARLKKIRDARQPVRIDTALDTYENMVMTSLQIPQNAQVGEALRFTATFQQVIIVTNNRTTIRTSSPGGGKKQDRGKKESLVWSKKELLWRVGKPPGGPKTGQTIIMRFAVDTTVDTYGRYYIPNGANPTGKVLGPGLSKNGQRFGDMREMTTEELEWAIKDFERDKPKLNGLDYCARPPCTLANTPASTTKAPVADLRKTGNALPVGTNLRGRNAP